MRSDSKTDGSGTSNQFFYIFKKSQLTCSWFSLCLFHTVEYNSNQHPYFYPIPPPTHILSVQGILVRVLPLPVQPIRVLPLVPFRAAYEIRDMGTGTVVHWYVICFIYSDCGVWGLNPGNGQFILNKKGI